MDFINNLNAAAKVAIGLVIAENMYNIISMDEPGYKTGREALDSCWKWLEGEKIDADDLCNYIDSEDFVDVAEFANKEKDVQKQYAWYSVLDAVSYTTYQAYKKEKRDFVPQVIEVIDDETLRILGENAIESGYFNIESLNNVKKYLLENYSLNHNIENYNYIKRGSLPLF
ncbi:Imm6 family immunity protein [Peribacillus frigoritolerans]|uniref:Imm6 family immunity protein n=1 Tax=Peribacillus frigoritolerans TaxID=450367 RepID=A0AAJ1VB78_9BACI|nr:Imm6 family immunity protein [Peribacillus frigoritolerans]MDM5284309.1 Imm6 family immunity protein [Peribacillus frigoritolerans]